MTESSRVYEAMKQDIILCEISPGTSVSEGELCSRYEAGRTPVREATRRLHEESLLQIIPFRGCFIAPLTVSEYRNLHEAQFIVEPEVAALAAQRATTEQVKRIEAFAEYEYYPGERKSYSTFLQRNYELHLEIASAGGNQILYDTVGNLQVRLMRYFYFVISMDSYGRQLVEEHRAIARAIRRRDPELARAKAGEHLERTLRRSSSLDFTPTAVHDEIIPSPLFRKRPRERAGAGRRS